MPLPTPHRPWTNIVLDFFTDLPESEQKIVILVITERFSCSIYLIPLAALPTAFELVEIMFNQVFRFYGIPEDMVSDRGPQFTSQVWHSFLWLASHLDR